MPSALDNQSFTREQCVCLNYYHQCGGGTNTPPSQQLQILQRLEKKLNKTKGGTLLGPHRLGHCVYALPSRSLRRCWRPRCGSPTSVRQILLIMASKGTATHQTKDSNAIPRCPIVGASIHHFSQYHQISMCLCQQDARLRLPRFFPDMVPEIQRPARPRLTMPPSSSSTCP